MRGKITKIDVLKHSISGSVSYTRVYFELYMLEGKKFAKTDLVPTFRNYKRWKDYLKIGTVLEGLRIKTDGKVFTVDADSYPTLVSWGEEPKIVPEQSKLL